MRLKSIGAHLRPYVMLARRRTTINHAFASAIAPSDAYEEAKVRDAVSLLQAEPDGDLECAYCGKPAETWDHIHATVRESQFSGHGHRIGNLLPCCKPCNSRKGNKAWDAYLTQLGHSAEEYTRRREAISGYLHQFGVQDDVPRDSGDMVELDRIRREVLRLLQEGDHVAARIRAAATVNGAQGGTHLLY